MSEPDVRASDEEPALVAAPLASPLSGGEAVAPTAIRALRPKSGLVRVLVSVAALAFVAFGLPGMLDRFWLQIVTSVVIYSIVTLGLGLLIGRAGMVSLCQFLLLAIGAWVALRLHYATSLPFPVLVLIAGVVTGVIGALIGLPALRLSGLYLALITLMAAGAITVVLRIAQFPNGGGGFFGNSAAGGASSRLSRPAIATGDTAYYRYCVAVAVLMFLLALWHVRGKPGRAWAALRQSQATAVAAGVNVTLYRLWAFALASFMAGVAGGLLAAASGGVNINQFPVQNSILLLAVVLMGGVYSLGGAIVAALLLRLLPALLDDWGVSTELLTILFGVGILQVLLTAPGGLVDQVPKDLANLGRRLRKLVGLSGPRRAGDEAPPP
ncbi:MAG TPA: branched-chain amino acid ABC transporter permease [Acidimicrobiales bacterium]|nr:branched-chain amino acid ABC transporter permease [Acidimicrobiales bacterium]